MKQHFSSRTRGLLLVAAAVSLLAFLQFFQSPGENLLWLSAMDAGHVPLFGVFALVTLGVVTLLLKGRNAPPLLRYVLAFVITAGVGVLTELLQFYGPRDADLVDLARSMSGALIFLLLALVFDRGVLPPAPRRRGMVKAVLIAVAIGLLGACLASFTLLARAYAKRAEAFPRICDFESSWESKFYDIHDADFMVTALPEPWRADGSQRAGRLTFHPGTYPGFHIKELNPDWRGYDRLCLDVYSEESTPRELVVRAHDAHHGNEFTDRFNRSVVVHPGENRFCFPLSEVRAAPEERKMDMAHMHGLALFAVRPDSAFSVYVDAIRLEKN